MRVLAYGELKWCHIGLRLRHLRGEGVRDIMRRFLQIPFVAAAQVHGHLYDLGAYPGLIVDATGPVVIGELYAVDAMILSALDAIQGDNADDPAASY